MRGWLVGWLVALTCVGGLRVCVGLIVAGAVVAGWDSLSDVGTEATPVAFGYVAVNNLCTAMFLTLVGDLLRLSWVRAALLTLCLRASLNRANVSRTATYAPCTPQSVCRTGGSQWFGAYCRISRRSGSCSTRASSGFRSLSRPCCFLMSRRD